MLTYYVRHTEKLGIDDATLERLCLARQVAIRFPRYASKPNWRARDNASLNPDDYPSKNGRNQMQILTELAADGGYVCAEFRKHDGCVVGYVPRHTPIRLVRGIWGDRYPEYAGRRRAILKALKLQRARWVDAADAAPILLCRPQQGTISRWPSVMDRIADIVEGRRRRTGLSSLLVYQQEVMVSEFLRTQAAHRAGLPTVAMFLTPIGRTMKDIDLYGVTSDGQRVFAQTTFREMPHCSDKIHALRRYRSKNSSLLFFCNCDQPWSIDGVQVFPLQQVYERFSTTLEGKLWLRMALASNRGNA